jgi:demethylphylloquinone reductase
MHQVNESFQQQIKGTLVPDASCMQICILGGGFGGLYTALSLCRHPALNSSAQYQITLVEQRDHFLFTPLLYEVVTNELQPWEVAPSYQQLLAHRSIQFRQAKICGVDLPHRLVHLQDVDAQGSETIAYDYLVLAVGGETRLESIPGASTNAQPFRTLEDVERLQEKLWALEASDRSTLEIAVVGAGPSGVELACKLADRLKPRGRVRLIDRGETILKPFAPGLQTAAYRALVKRGVQLELNTNITAIDPHQITLETLGESRAAAVDLVLWTAGTQPLAWTQELACRQSETGRILVTPTLQLLDYPEVFALGDLAEIRRVKGQAFQQAPCVALNLKALLMNRSLRPFRYLHLGDMLTLGRGEAVVSSFGLTVDGRLARLIRRVVYLQRLPTLEHRLRVIAHWLVNGIFHRLPHPGKRWLQPLVRRWKRQWFPQAAYSRRSLY